MTDELPVEDGGFVSIDLELPDDPDQAVDMLIAELSDARTAAESHLDDLKRVAADFENYRKRANREREEIMIRASERLVTDLLPVLDSLEAALAAEVDGGVRLLVGVRNTQQQMLDILTAHGLEPITAQGQPFDPNLHEAISGGGDGHLVVVAEVRRGYSFNGRVIRPALVQVAAEDLSEGD
ncbi:MAG: nucleotide exchange factor GrpE [Acidimicrobiia bacterium]